MPDHATKAILLTADLIRRRDDMRMLLSKDIYEARVKEYRSLLRAATEKHGLPIAEVALTLAKAWDKAGQDPSMLFAALVDELEARDD